LFLCNLIIIFEADSEDEGESSVSEDLGRAARKRARGRQGSGDEEGEGMD